MRSATEVVLVKLGGSLLTDKTRPRALRREVVRRLAAEIAQARRDGCPPLIVGHGSGSFGHTAARRHRFASSVGEARLLAGARVQLAAGELHRHVLRAFLATGLPALSLRPAAWLAVEEDSGEGDTSGLTALVAVLDSGAIPVVCGDLVADRRLGLSIASTERVFSTLVDGLPDRGYRVSRILWLGETAGILDPAGRTVPLLDPATRAALDRSLAGSSGVDVTGGVRLRVDTALALAERRVPSWILDGRKEGTLHRALLGERVGGTEVPAKEA